MALTITLRPELEKQIREDAARAGLTAEQLATQRLIEADLLWRIRTATPEAETRHLHRLLRRSRVGTITEAERTHLQTILDEREDRGARRLQALTQLSQIRAMPVRNLMELLGIRPIASP